MIPRFPSLNFFSAAALNIPAVHHHHTKAPENLLNGPQQKWLRSKPLQQTDLVRSTRREQFVVGTI